MMTAAEYSYRMVEIRDTGSHNLTEVNSQLMFLPNHILDTHRLILPLLIYL